MKILIAAVTTVSLIAGSVTPAFADRRDNDRQEWRGDHDRDHRDRHEDRRDDRRDPRHDSRHDEHARDNSWQHDHRSHAFYDHRDQRRFQAPHYVVPRYVAPRGYHARVWHRGDRLPAAYYSSRYVVRDYHAYRLYAPPRGHHWVRVDNDVLLTAVATGAVVAVVSGLFH